MRVHSGKKDNQSFYNTGVGVGPSQNRNIALEASGL